MVGAVPSVDRLPRIADQTDVSSPSPPRLEQRVLERVEVLCFVDEEVAKSPVHERAECLVRLHRAEVEVQQVVEIDDTAAPLQAFIRSREIDEPAGGHDASPPGGARLAFVVGGLDAACPCPIDVGHRRVGIQLETQFLQALPHQTRAIGCQRRHGLVASQRAVAQKSQGDAVERACLDRFVDVEASQSAPELAGRIAGERQCSDVTRFGLAGFDAIGDPASQDGRLARSRRRHDGQRSGLALDSAALVGVEAHQETIRGHVDTIRRSRPAPRQPPGCRVASDAQSLQSCSCRSRRRT